MKKFIGILSILLACTFLFACSNGNQAQVKLASKKISGGLDKMISQVKKLEDVNSDKMDLTSLLGEERDTSDGYHCYNDGCYYCENGNCYKCKDCPQNDTSNTNRSDVSTGRRNVRQNIYPYREVLNSKVPTKNHMTQRANVNLFAGNDYRATRRNLNLANGNGNYNDLRTACNNVCDLNKEYSNTKTSLINNCNKAKQLLERLKNGEAKLSDSDVKTLNSYYEVIKQCNNNISSCKSCKSTVNTIGKKKLNLASNSGSMTADYRNVYNCLDANCNACNNANNSVLDLIAFANKLLGEKQDEAMLGTSTGANRYNSAKNQYTSNRNRWTTVNDYQNGQRYSSNGINSNNNRYTNNDRYSYNTNPYTKDIKDPQRYNENRRNNIVNNGTTTLLPTEYEKPVVDNTTNNTLQNNTSSNTIPANNTTVTKRLPNDQTTNRVTNSNIINNSNSTTTNRTDNKSTNNTNYGITYNKNGNSIINNSNYASNKTTTNNSQTNYTSNTNYNRNYPNNNVNRNTTYNNSNYNSNNIARNNTTNYNSSNVNSNNATNYTNNNVARNNNTSYNNVARNNTTNYNGTNNYNQNTTNNSNYNSRNYGTNSTYNTSRNNPRVNYYAPTTNTLRTNAMAYISNIEPMPLEPQQCEKPLAYGPRQVRA